LSSYTHFDAGRFNRQLTVEVEVETPDGGGGFTSAFVAQDTVWAHICPVNARMVDRADTRETEITHQIFMRFRAGISSAVRFVTGTRKFEVLSVRDPDETRRYLECNVIERSS